MARSNSAVIDQPVGKGKTKGVTPKVTTVAKTDKTKAAAAKKSAKITALRADVVIARDTVKESKKILKVAKISESAMLKTQREELRPLAKEVKTASTVMLRSEKALVRAQDKLTKAL